LKEICFNPDMPDGGRGSRRSRMKGMRTQGEDAYVPSVHTFSPCAHLLPSTLA